MTSVQSTLPSLAISLPVVSFLFLHLSILQKSYFFHLFKILVHNYHLCPSLSSSDDIIPLFSYSLFFPLLIRLTLPLPTRLCPFPPSLPSLPGLQSFVRCQITLSICHSCVPQPGSILSRTELRNQQLKMRNIQNECVMSVSVCYIVSWLVTEPITLFFP